MSIDYMSPEEKKQELNEFKSKKFNSLKEFVEYVKTLKTIKIRGDIEYEAFYSFYLLFPPTEKESSLFSYIDLFLDCYEGAYDNMENYIKDVWPDVGPPDYYFDVTEYIDAKRMAEDISEEGVCVHKDEYVFINPQFIR